MDISLPSETGQLAISLELLLLLQWLVKNEPESVKKLVKQASKNGFSANHTIKKNARSAVNIAEELDLHLCVSDFFGLLEAALHNIAIHEEDLKPISSTLNQIDTNCCDNETITLSALKTTSSLKKDAEKNAKETLCKELLKNWRSHGKIH